MLITVAICTRDRPASLERTLDSLQSMTVPAGSDWELLVVDNGSGNATASLLRSWKGRLPLRMERESVPGLSNARNRAVHAARGEFIAWTDDDVRVHPDWLRAYAHAFDLASDAGFFGGPIEASFDATPPAWLPRVLDRVPGAFAIRDLGPRTRELGPGLERLPFGANYAVRTDVQRRHLYDPNLGLQPGRPARGEETAVFLAMHADGETGRWVPEARVTHLIAPERQNEGHIRAFYRLDAATRPGAGRPGVHRRMLLLNALRSEARFQLLRRIATPERWIGALISASEAWGEWHRYRSRALTG